MANKEHLKIIRQGVAAWNEWRKNNPELIPDLLDADLRKANLSGSYLLTANLSNAELGGANLSGANLSEANLSNTSFFEAYLRAANLRKADLRKAFLREANLSGADLRKADLRKADLSEADLSEANLSEADLSGADLSEANLSGANLGRANLGRALLVRTDLRDASLTESSVYGASVWDIKVDDKTKQQNLVITPADEPAITVDNIKVAQFIYLLLNNKEIRDVIDTITSKAVLILGRFSDERKPVLDAIRDELRKPEHNYLPIVFDFPSLTSQTTIETIRTLASMARFIIADITDARSVIQELYAIVPGLPSVAVRLLIKKSAHEYGMLDYFRRYPWVVNGSYRYKNVEELIASIKMKIIVPAEAKVKELRQK